MSEFFKVHCNFCGRETKHSSLTTRDKVQNVQLKDGSVHTWHDLGELLECAGCEHLTLRRTIYEEGDQGPFVFFYPPRVSRPEPKWRFSLPHPLSSLVSEVYEALHADSRRLAAMGARAIIEVVMLDTIGDVGTFRDKLAHLEAKGLIATRNRNHLAAALDAGSAAIHRGHIPTAEDLNHVMDIVENLLQSVYVLEKAADALRSVTPKRKR